MPLPLAVHDEAVRVHQREALCRANCSAPSPTRRWCPDRSRTRARAGWDGPPGARWPPRHVERAAIHQPGVELHPALRGEHRAAAGVEGRVVLERARWPATTASSAEPPEASTANPARPPRDSPRRAPPGLEGDAPGPPVDHDGRRPSGHERPDPTSPGRQTRLQDGFTGPGGMPTVVRHGVPPSRSAGSESWPSSSRSWWRSSSSLSLVLDSILTSGPRPRRPRSRSSSAGRWISAGSPPASSPDSGRRYRPRGGRRRGRGRAAGPGEGGGGQASRRSRALFSMGKDIVVRSVEVAEPMVNVVRLPDGTTNLERLQARLARAAEAGGRRRRGGARGPLRRSGWSTPR